MNIARRMMWFIVGLLLASSVAAFGADTVPASGPMAILEAQIKVLQAQIAAEGSADSTILAQVSALAAQLQALQATADTVAQLQQQVAALQTQLANIQLTPGPQGLPGRDGTNGRDGVNGRDGISIQGPPGPAGPQGVPGTDGGDSLLKAYDAVGNVVGPIVFVDYSTIDVHTGMPTPIPYVRLDNGAVIPVFMQHLAPNGPFFFLRTAAHTPGRLVTNPLPPASLNGINGVLIVDGAVYAAVGGLVPGTADGDAAGFIYPAVVSGGMVFPPSDCSACFTAPGTMFQPMQATGEHVGAGPYSVR